MGTYSSWISVSDFMLTVEAENEDEARELMKNQLKDIEVVLYEHGTEQVQLGCTVTDVDVL